MPTVTVAWGDTQTSQVEAPGDEDEWSFVNEEHTYAAPGTYTISVTGPGAGSTTMQVTVPDASEPALVLTVPAVTATTQGVQKEFTTGLKNLTPVAVPEAVQTIRLWREDGVTLMPNQVHYETYDSGSWKVKQFGRDGTQLVSIEAYPVPGSLDATSQVRITLSTAAGSEVFGRSSVYDRDGGELLDDAEYKFTVAAAPAVTITNVSPSALTAGTATPTFTITGTGFPSVLHDGTSYTVWLTQGGTPMVPVVPAGGVAWAAITTETQVTPVAAGNPAAGSYGLAIFDQNSVAIAAWSGTVTVA